jgi:hypothetical protein
MERMVTVEGRPVRYLDAGTGPADLAAAHLELVDQVTRDLAREL